MHPEIVLKQLPVVEGSLHPLTDLEIPETWGPRGQFAPVYFRPQLFSELKEVLEVAGKNQITMIPFGTFQGFCPLNPPPATLLLLVQPGSCSIWRGVESRNRIAHFPASLSVEEAEDLAEKEGFTLSPGLFDRGSLGGNWVLPRGSFLTFTYLDPKERLIGVNAILSDGSLLSSRIVPRSAAGPNFARALMGMGIVRGLVVEVILRLEPLGAKQYFRSVLPAEFLFERLRDLIQKGYAPTACSVFLPPGGEAVFYLSHHLRNRWEEKTIRRIREVLPLEEFAPPIPKEHKPPAGWGSFRLPWSALFKKRDPASALYLSDPSPEGILFWAPPDLNLWERLPFSSLITPSTPES